MIKPPELLETTRLRLRMPFEDDAEIIYRKYAQDQEVTKYLIWRAHENVNVSKVFLQRCIQCWKDETAFPWVVIRKKDNELVGMIELRVNSFRVDFGYVIAREYWGNGYATEIAKSLIEWSMMQKNIYRVSATCDCENLASARVLEKSGMHREGILRRYTIHPNISEEPRDSFCYSIVK